MLSLSRNVDVTGTSSDLDCSITSNGQVSHHNAVPSLNGVIGNPYSSFIGDPDYSDDSEIDGADGNDIRREKMFEDQVQFGDRLETIAYHLGYSNIINFTDSKSLWNLV